MSRKTKLTHAVFAFLFGAALAGIVQHLFWSWFQAGPTWVLRIVAVAGFSAIVYVLLNLAEQLVSRKRTA